MRQQTQAELYARAKQVMPGGCSRNTILRKPHPVYAKAGKGCYIEDIDGKQYIDFANNMASLIHGHAHPQITQAVTEQLAKGSAFTFATEVEIEYAELLCRRNSAFEKLRFVNSGTEAVMSCIKAARAYTGRSKIAKVEGAYHGLYDFAEISQTANPHNWGNAEQPQSVPVAYGTPAGVLDDVVIIPFNDPELALQILNQYGDDIAAIIVDPLPHRVGLFAASDTFIHTLKQWTQQQGSLLIFDEVISFRTEFGGAQAHYGVTPDLTALGKLIGGGFPVGAITGKREVMQVMDPLSSSVRFPHSGTFSANPITMTAGLTAMQLFDQTAVTKLNQLTTTLKSQLEQAIANADVPVCVTGKGSMLRLHMQANTPQNYRQTYLSPLQSQIKDRLLDYLFEQGFAMINTCSLTLSTAHRQQQIDQLSDAVEQGLKQLKPMFSQQEAS